eukprot:9485341-Pyramimonas_sp.AAC.1
MDLGVAQYVIGATFHQLIKNNFSGSAATRKPARDRQCLLDLRRRIRAHYLATGANRKRGAKSMIGRLTLKMFQPAKAGSVPRLKAKAAESRNLVPLLPLLCQEHY